GRADEASQTQPTNTAVLIKNEDGAFTPGNPASPYYPHVRRGLPLRILAPGGTPHMVGTVGPGNHASTPDHASLDITGDLWVAAEVQLADLHGFTSPGVADLVAKWGTVGSRSYYLLASGESLFFFWSTDG